jgi:thiol-disulfide isomerase/thioredoxin
VSRVAGAVLLGAALACHPQSGDVPARQRAEVVTQSRAEISAAEWCDVYYAPEKAPALVLPPSVPLGTGGALAAKPTTWVWLNLWATWCKPCVREMPLVIAFGAHLRDEGMSLSNWFVSLDEPGPELQAFIRQHPELSGATSLRLSSPDELDAWTGRYGLKSGTTIPINIIVAPGGAVRCVRAGSIADGDYARVRAVLKQL